MINPESLLSKRQLEVLESWGRCPDAELVANELNLSVHTVRTHLKRSRKKRLGVHKTVQVFLLLQQSGEVGIAGMDDKRGDQIDHKK